MQITIDEIRNLLFMGKRIYDIPLRVTFYGRVSTDEVDQLSSLTNQINYFEDKIKDCPNWTYVKGYIDEGISGTRIDKRPQFKKMILDAKAGKFNLILTKEVSRFARDIVDAVQTIRELLQSNVGVFFEDLQLNTVERDSEFRLSIMATVAQEESRKISDRVRFGYKQTMKNGKRHGAAAPLGYQFNNENNGYIVDSVLAPMVQSAFQIYATNEIGVRKLGLKLADMGYLNAQGKPYSATTLKRMLQHPVYLGNIVNGKSYKQSYRSDKIISKDKDNWTLHYDPVRVPPLVDKPTWDKVNLILNERHKKMEGIDTSSKDSLGGGKFAYSGRIVCDKHNTNYVHAVGRWYAVDGTPKTVSYWRCGTYARYGRKACDSPLLYTTDLNEIMRELFRSQAGVLQSTSKSLSSIIEEMLSPDNSENNLDELYAHKESLDKKKEKLLDGWVNGIISGEDYKSASGKIDAQLEQLETKIADVTHIKNSINVMEQSALVMSKITASANLESDSAIEELVRSFLKKIVVKSPINIEEKYYELQIYLYNSDSPITCDVNENTSSLMYPKHSSMLQKRILLGEFIFTIPMRTLDMDWDRRLGIKTYLVI